MRVAGSNSLAPSTNSCISVSMFVYPAHDACRRQTEAEQQKQWIVFGGDWNGVTDPIRDRRPICQRQASCAGYTNIDTEMQLFVEGAKLFDPATRIELPQVAPMPESVWRNKRYNHRRSFQPACSLSGAKHLRHLVEPAARRQSDRSLRRRLVDPQAPRRAAAAAAVAVDGARSIARGRQGG